jgi:hypothetical protein
MTVKEALVPSPSVVLPDSVKVSVSLPRSL